MKIALSQLNFIVGDLNGNCIKIIDAINQAKQQQCHLIVFSELSICGYAPQDLLDYNNFIEQCEQKVLEVAKTCIGIHAIVGAPTRNPNPTTEGKNLYNSALVLNEGKIVDTYNKGLLPNYDVFDEYRYFESAKKFNCVTINNTKIALTVCEDIWDVEEDLMYTVSPLDELTKEKPQLIINISASPFNYNHLQNRANMLARNNAKYKLPILYVNQVGCNTELIFDGGTMAFNNAGKKVLQANYYEEDFSVLEFKNNDIIGSLTAEKPIEKVENIYKALVYAVQDYFAKTGFTKAVIGLSGGVDSALTACIAVDALGKENVLGILMPSEFSSDHSVKDAEDLAKNLGCDYHILPIKENYESLRKTLAPLYKDLPFNVAEENLQARIRGILVMGVSNKFGHILLNTTNKSEAAVGYGTLYGDMCGGIAVLADVYKTEIYEVCNYVNKDKIRIPVNTLTKAPSAELRPNQKDSDSLPEYDLLDAILFQYIENIKTATEIIKMGYDEKTVTRVVRLINLNEYKRKQMAPVLRVSPKAFGYGRRMPIVGKY
ncbi:MAG: NAD+ synthase [Bacteroidota bacterium]